MWTDMLIVDMSPNASRIVGDKLALVHLAHEHLNIIVHDFIEMPLDVFNPANIVWVLHPHRIDAESADVILHMLHQ